MSNIIKHQQNSPELKTIYEPSSPIQRLYIGRKRVNTRDIEILTETYLDSTDKCYACRNEAKYIVLIRKDDKSNKDELNLYPSCSKIHNGEIRIKSEKEY